MEKIEGDLLRSLVNVAQLLKEPVGSTRSYDISGIIKDQVEASVEGKIILIRSGRGVLIQGELAAEIKLTCSRCLGNFLCPISFAVEEEVLPVDDVSRDLVLSLPEKADGFTININGILDLGELIRQYTLLNLPMKPLCRPDCAGIKEMNSYGTT
jgi:uncharacterized protein